MNTIGKKLIVRMMDIQKKKSKTILTISLLILLLIITTACFHRKELVIDDFKDNIFAGMTEKQVKGKLGQPIKIEDASEKAIKSYDEDSNLSGDIWPDSYLDKFLGDEKREKYILKKMDKETGWEYYEYDYKDEHLIKPKEQNKQFRIYFVDGEVVWMSFP